MSAINNNFQLLSGNYLFAAMARKTAEFKAAHPDADVIRLGIGDVTRPLVPAVVGALHRAVEEMGDAATFRGYGPEQGYDFLRRAIAEGEYAPRGVKLELDEIFVSDGSKCDVGNIQELFDLGSRVAICDPVYPVYLDSNIMAGRAGRRNPDGRYSRITYLPCDKSNDFTPDLPTGRVDLIYLCSPNNPTGKCFSRENLARWVRYAQENEAVILYDSAYSSYIQEADPPRSIYEIEGAREVAVEFKSFSKSAGFTGTRCAFTVIPRELRCRNAENELVALNPLFLRRQCTKFNGVAYFVQRAAEAVYSPEGKKETADVISYYMENARIIRNGLSGLGFECFGGVNAPYLWWKLPAGVKSMDFFDTLLEHCGVVGTPGSGFGPSGEGYFRLTAFGDRERTVEAVGRLAAL